MAGCPGRARCRGLRKPRVSSCSPGPCSEGEGGVAEGLPTGHTVPASAIAAGCDQENERERTPWGLLLAEEGWVGAWQAGVPAP